MSSHDKIHILNQLDNIFYIFFCRFIRCQIKQLTRYETVTIVVLLTLLRTGGGPPGVLFYKRLLFFFFFMFFFLKVCF